MNGEIQFSITGGNPNTMFQITSDGQLKTKGNIDREQRDQYNLQISAHDSGLPSRSVEKTYRIDITDVNDNPPVFEKSVYHTNIQENMAVDSDILVQV